jgi:class 3 adenylate cyclase
MRLGAGFRYRSLVGGTVADPRIARLLEATALLARGRFPVHVHPQGDDDVARLGWAIDALGHRLERLFEEARLVSAVTRDVNRGLLLDEVLERIYESFRGVIPYERIGFALLSEDGARVRAHWARSDAETPRLPRGYTAPLAGSSLAGVLATGRPRILNDLEAHLAGHPDSDSTRRIVEEGMRSSLTCPLVAAGRPLGFLFFSSRTPGAYEDAHVETFVQVAGQLAVILEKSRLYQEILEARARTERLLLDVLPEPIARRLEAGEGVIADHVEDATVLFADIAGFSALAARVPPDALVRFLDGFFSHLDRLAARHGVEKIKTIGDAWLAAAGVPLAREGHAAAACALALEVAAAAAEHPRPDGAPLRVRVGLHSGPVVAGVIGRSRLVYDLWGETVNVARRMESEGTAGRVQVTSAVLARAGGGFRGVARGPVPMKEGGAVEGFWLERA